MSAGAGVTVWLTGLPAAGKTTVANGVAEALRVRGLKVEVLDGDVVRTNLSKGLGYSKEDRDTNVRRIGFVCELLARNGVVAIAAAISPYRDVRDEVRRRIGRFVEVLVSCPLEELVRRDTKGLYAKALRGELPNFSGVSDPYEQPLAPEVLLQTNRETVAESVAKVIRALETLGHIPAADGLVPPHGGRLVDRVVPSAPPAGRHRIHLSPRQLADLHMLAVGAYSPLDGFLRRADYDAVVSDRRLSSGLVWPIPITLAASTNDAKALSVGEDVPLVDDTGGAAGTLRLAEVYEYDKEREARLVYGTTDAAHPGVAALLAQGDVLLGGSISLAQHPRLAAFARYDLPPVTTRRLFRERGWRRVVGFQTRNPIHRAHEYLVKVALEISDGLLVHPLVGETKSDDVPAAVRMRSYEALLDAYFPKERVILAIYPGPMRYAGPREAVLHALVRQNYGCSHFIVGRDHAGVGSYYGPYDAQRIFSEFAPGEIGITPLFFEHTFYCRRCAAMTSSKTCPHDPSEHESLSGTKVRRLLGTGELLPPELSRPEVARVLAIGEAAPQAPASLSR